MKDISEAINEIVWRVDGKVKKILRNFGNGSVKEVEFDYDAMGNRVAKHVTDNGTGLLEKSTYYLLDAQGNTMATYDFAVNQVDGSTAFKLKERHIYGSSRVGMVTTEVNMLAPMPNNGSFALGERFYELTNHQNSVLTTITDRKLPHDSNSDGTVDYYTADIIAYADYYPYGMVMPGRNGNASEYRYGFNGKEEDPEIKGEGNSYNFGARIYDPRVGRWLSIDPLASKYPYLTPYNFSANNPVFFNDPNGEDIGETVKYENDKNAQAATKLAYSNDIVKGLFDLFAKQNSGIYRSEVDGSLSNHDLYFGTNVGMDNGLTELSIWDPNKEKWVKLKNADKQITDGEFKVRLEINMEVFTNEDYNPSQVGENLDVLVHELYVHANNAVKILQEWESSGKSTEDLAKLKKDLQDWVDAGGDAEHKSAASNQNKVFTDVSKSFMKQLWEDFSNESDVDLKAEKREIYSKFVGRLVSETQRGGSDEFEKEIREYDAQLKAENPE